MHIVNKFEISSAELCSCFFYCGFKVTLNTYFFIPKFEFDFDCMSLSSEYEFEFEQSKKKDLTKRHIPRRSPIQELTHIMYLQ